jgi:hypothetical protein
MVVAFVSFGQGNVGQSIIEYNGQKYPCYVVEFNLSPEVTEQTIRDKIKSRGYNPKETKGFLVYRAIRLPLLDSLEDKDVFIKVDKKSRSEKDKSVVYLIATKPGEIPEEKVKDTDKNAAANIALVSGGALVLSGFGGDVDMAAYHVALSIQEDEVKKADKKMKDLQEDQTKLEKKIKDMQDDLEVNKKDQVKQQEEITKHKQILEEKKGKKPAGN